MSDDTEYVDYGLANLIKSLKTNPQARVGVLGSKNARKDGTSNAEIGAKHEFGEEGLPIRSFLRVPITEKMQKTLDKADFGEEIIKEIIKEASLVPIVKKIGVLGEGIVLFGFETGGYGKWKPANMEFKKTKQTLVESEQLRDSITSDVTE